VASHLELLGVIRQLSSVMADKVFPNALPYTRNIDFFLNHKLTINKHH